ncbi:hypothetical protein CC78DRAFT_567104 [Lojkania enalia]|uniref:Nucleoporin Pom152 n=1 Tax=Lojkania enalia TaxID=147567 RepID=A0A9P4KE74_9PLEO|nr:hypothetical protein CC78DRAFT_567104 [Didymosphaeria enalia]
MNETPRRGPGGFPATPQANRSPGIHSSDDSNPRRPNIASPLPNVPRTAPAPRSGPLIPTDILDPAQQRFYVVAFYALLWAWKLWDFYSLAIGEDESMALCLKWVFFDLIFLFCLPLLEIPWLEWGNKMSFGLFVLHAILDYMLMSRVGIPVQSWFVAFLAFIYDSELAISERSVNPGKIIQNSSLILGKQIINILPEGSAILNPNRESLCLNSSVTQLEIPIQINQTEPVAIDLFRIDIETNRNETITIKGSELKGILKKARKNTKNFDTASPLMIQYPVRKTGVYLLKRVLDQSKLEVRPKTATIVITSCPKAHVKPTRNSRCRNDLSDVTLEVEGTPPLRIKYRTTVEGRPREASEFQSLQPDDFVSPLSRHTSQALVHSNHRDVSWARAQKVKVALNETLMHSGLWLYAVEEVQDALGNIVSYVGYDDEDRPRPKFTGTQGSFTVHERPSVKLLGCNAQSPLRVAKGNTARLPVEYGSTATGHLRDPHVIEYLFTQEHDLLPDGYHGPNAELKKQKLRTREQPLISTPGLYTIKSIATEFCQGEVLEPASCLLQNPPEPELSLSSEDIVDKCAGNPIGLRVGLDFIGTPPFTIKYTEQRERKKRIVSKRIDTLRSTIDLAPSDAGQYVYTFDSIQDHIYREERPLHGLILHQNVKPSVSAHFIEASESKQACIDDSVEFDVKLQGEGPWTLGYELIHNGKRTKHSVEVKEEIHTIKTHQLKNGGEYIVALASITDKMGCKEYLDDQTRVNVRHERPRAYFGHIEGKHSIMALEGKDVELPLRLTGIPPWTLEYENLDLRDAKIITMQNANDRLDIKVQGVYQLLSVSDSVCPGFIDEKDSQFSVSWIPRPEISVLESASMLFEGNNYVKEAVCEGDEDSFDVALIGNPPFAVTYEQHFNNKKSGKGAARSKQELRALGRTASIRAETGQAGTYEYRFVKLSDSKYDHVKKYFTPVTVQQTVNPRPNARFINPGKTYSYCSREEDGEQVIPVTLEGLPPFYLEVEIKHHGTPKPEISIHKNIPSSKYDLKIEHRKLHLGTSAISIRKIRDARGCIQKPATDSPRVQISVHDAPTATPLEDRMDFCVGERLSFALGGQVPFTVFYTFEKQERKASNAGTTFRRLAELPGTFRITNLRDSASECMASLQLTKEIHPIPSVRLSGGQVSEVDIHEGGGTDLEFQFWGTPPFEFTYTRSTNAQRGRKSKVLEIRTEVSHDYHMSIPVQEEGTYEVVSIKDRWCSFAKQIEGVGAKGGQKLL